MNKHEEFVEKLRSSFYDNIMSDKRIMNNGQKNEKDTKDADLYSSFTIDSLFDDED